MHLNNPTIRFYCSRWGHEQVPWNTFLDKVIRHGFQGVEIIALRFPEQKQEMLTQLSRSGLDYTLIHTEKNEGSDFNRYIDKLEKNLLEIADSYQTRYAVPRFIISQTGREYYSKAQVNECLAICKKVSVETGIPIIQETHRHRWSYAAHIVDEYIREGADLKLAMDISHWFCVSESYLEDQQEAVDRALEKSVHLHARVGHTQGPQVTDPRAPENATALSHHLRIWDRWFEIQRQNKIWECSITPEFGPAPYMAYKPFSTQPVADLWEINCWMKDLLAERYSD